MLKLIKMWTINLNRDILCISLENNDKNVSKQIQNGIMNAPIIWKYLENKKENKV